MINQHLALGAYPAPTIASPGPPPISTPPGAFGQQFVGEGRVVRVQTRGGGLPVGPGCRWGLRESEGTQSLLHPSTRITASSRECQAFVHNERDKRNLLLLRRSGLMLPHSALHPRLCSFASLG